MQKYIKIYTEYHDIGEQDIVLCEVCGAVASDVHHIVYKSQGGKDEIENLIGLCRTCHDRAHFKLKPYLQKEDLYEKQSFNQTTIS